MWKNRVVYLAALLAAALFYLNYEGWISWYTLLLVLILPLFSAVIGLFSLIGLKITVQGGGSCRRGEPREITYTLDCRLNLSGGCRMWVALEDRLTGKNERSRLTLQKGVPETLPAPTEHCGETVFRPQKARVYDPLGLLPLPVKLPESRSVTALPEVIAPETPPDFSAFQAKSYQPKPGGGFSEIHENRLYRPGDPLRSVHWKLSAKTEDLIVREAQEARRRTVLITFDPSPDREKLDTILGQVHWTSLKLLELETPHEIGCPAPQEADLTPIRSVEDLDGFFLDLLKKPILQYTAVSDRYPHADWRYHVTPPEGREVAR